MDTQQITITVPVGLEALAASRGQTVQSYVADLVAGAVAEAEWTADMASLRTKHTGLPNTIFVSVAFPGHKPRIKVAIDPPTHLDPFGDTASIALSDGQLLAGDLPQKLLAQVWEFIHLNRGVLLDYWHKRIDIGDLKDRLEPIPR